MEYTRNSDLVEMGIDEFAKDSAPAKQKQAEAVTTAEKPKRGRKPKA